MHALLVNAGSGSDQHFLSTEARHIAAPIVTERLATSDKLLGTVV